MQCARGSPRGSSVAYRRVSQWVERGGGGEFFLLKKKNTGKKTKTKKQQRKLPSSFILLFFFSLSGEQRALVHRLGGGVVHMRVCGVCASSILISLSSLSLLQRGGQ
eukprot:TRINITY_DN445_c3_g4_i1.p5 TRINITY_DN445_c3_g4~~TRINITY_DN445_c3_g4_i1.p5  ORF type:complete len:107 (-),score=5.14 TRINITY_DN445_c3_g4_i1:407-727(-)